jgi:hypothetical protein
VADTVSVLDRAITMSYFRRLFARLLVELFRPLAARCRSYLLAPVNIRLGTLEALHKEDGTSSIREWDRGLQPGPAVCAGARPYSQRNREPNARVQLS